MREKVVNRPRIFGKRGRKKKKKCTRGARNVEKVHKIFQPKTFKRMKASKLWKHST